MKKVIDYSITPIYFYRFVCNDPNIVNMYVGSSINLTRRKSDHKSACNNPTNKGYNLLVYKTIRDNGGWDNWRMLEIEHKIVKDKSEAKQCEQYWIESYNAQMNMFKLNFNRQEYREQYYEQNKEQISDSQREYYQEHKDQILDYQREYREQNKEKNNASKRKYRQQNKEKIKAYNREYNRENRKQINAKQRERRQLKKQEKQNTIELV